MDAADRRSFWTEQMIERLIGESTPCPISPYLLSISLFSRTPPIYHHINSFCGPHTLSINGGGVRIFYLHKPSRLCVRTLFWAARGFAMNGHFGHCVRWNCCHARTWSSLNGHSMKTEELEAIARDATMWRCLVLFDEHWASYVIRRDVSSPSAMMN